MASSKEYLKFILGQLAELDEITYRARWASISFIIEEKLSVEFMMIDCL